MDAPDNGSLRGIAEQLALALVGAVALSGERAERLAEELAERGGMQRDAAREAIGDLASRWRGDAVRVSERTGATLAGIFRELGLVTREEFEELELRVAQIEHRLRLLEGQTPPPSH
jgi:polyhydroxyalkanoate synthesis regulator phasin